MQLFASVRVNVDSRMRKAIRLLLSACFLRNPFFYTDAAKMPIYGTIVLCEGHNCAFQEQLYRRGSNIRQPLRY